ncbi:hypothetical protein H4R34_005428, partial [Dimargaris verticillata]
SRIDLLDDDFKAQNLASLSVLNDKFLATYPQQTDATPPLEESSPTILEASSNEPAAIILSPIAMSRFQVDLTATLVAAWGQVTYSSPISRPRKKVP